MQSYRVVFMAVAGGLVLAACSDTTGPGGGPVLDCTDANTQVLAAGEHRVIDPATAGACVRLPQAGGTGAEYLYVPVATSAQITDAGVSAPYSITGSSPATAAPPAAALASPLLSAFRPPLPAAAFHSMLRARERALSRDHSAALFNQARLTAAAPVVGDLRTFQVCSTRSCDAFVPATAKARVVGQRVAIYVDTLAPPGGYTDPELTDVGTLFDQFLYPIDTVAFGRESDIDGNGVVVVLLTPKVNALSPGCNSSQSVILGFFFGADLLPMAGNNPGSNEAEIFYGIVPDPTNTDCTVSEEFARSRLPATFIHEFQHMISFNQHVLVRSGTAEDTWLNEGLSHFAEELGARQIPDTECPVSGSCANDFLSTGDLPNAFAYLASPEDFFMIEPGSSSGGLEERGANWLFVRWLTDQFATDTILGTDFTRRLDGTALIGANNVDAQTGDDFSTLVSQWQLANYLGGLPGFTASTPRLRYKSWNFHEVADSNGIAYPLVPDNTSGAGYTHTGVLRAGSGHHVLVDQAPNGGLVDLQLKSTTGGAVSAAVEARIGLVRIR